MFAHAMLTLSPNNAQFLAFPIFASQLVLIPNFPAEIDTLDTTTAGVSPNDPHPPYTSIAVAQCPHLANTRELPGRTTAAAAIAPHPPTAVRSRPQSTASHAQHSHMSPTGRSAHTSLYALPHTLTLATIGTHACTL